MTRTEQQRRAARNSSSGASPFSSSLSSSTAGDGGASTMDSSCASTTITARGAAPGGSGGSHTLRVVAHPASAYWPRSSPSSPSSSSSWMHNEPGASSSSSSGNGFASNSSKLSSSYHSSGGHSSSDSNDISSTLSSTSSSNVRSRLVHSLGNVPFPPVISGERTGDCEHGGRESGSSSIGSGGKPKRLLLAVGPDGGWAVRATGVFGGQVRVNAGKKPVHSCEQLSVWRCACVHACAVSCTFDLKLNLTLSTFSQRLRISLKFPSLSAQVPHELDLLAQHGFAPVSLAGNVGTLKTEVGATVRFMRLNTASSLC